MAIATINPATGQLVKQFEPLSDSEIDRFEKIPNVFLDTSESGKSEAAMKPGLA